MSQRYPCIERGTLPCQSYGAGHNLHAIHARHVGRTPWGWRDGVVTAVAGVDVFVRYLEADHEVRLWHHRVLGVTAGSLVRVHEQYYVLGGPFGWANVHVSDGLGALPQPAEPELWLVECVQPVVDLASGYALPRDHGRRT